MALTLYRAFATALAASLTSTHLASAGLIKQDTATKTLVLLDDWAMVETHSQFFGHIRDHLGHEIEFAMADTGPAGMVQHNDQYYFDNIVLMTPTVKGKSQL